MKLKELRTAKGLRQRDVAEILGVDRTTYAKYESGASEPSVETLIKLADVLEASTDYILGRTDILGSVAVPAEKSGIKLESEIENPDIRMVARAGQKMTSEQSKNLRKYAQYMFPEAFEDDPT